MPRKQAKDTTNSHVYMTSVKKAFAHKSPDQVLALAPSILSADFASLGTELRKMMRAKCYWAHCDVMDGHFVPNITIGPPVVKSLRAVSTRLFLDTHLMISDPMTYAPDFAKAGSDIITIHSETVDDLKGALREIRKMGVRPAVTIKPKTKVEEIEDALGEVDMVLVMTVEPGFGGQAMIANTLSKVRQLARIREERDLRFLIEVDGGINEKTAGMAVAAGANILVAGSAVFGAGNIAQNMDRLVKAAMEMAG